MPTIAVLALLLARPAAASPSWEKLYEPPEKKQALLAVWADDHGWFAAGPGLLLKGDAAGVKAETLGQRTVVGFSGASRAELFAVGWDELVLRLDGERWSEEHRALGLPTGEKRGRNNADLLQTVAILPGKPAPIVTAFGPALVLARHPDAFWQALPEPQRQAQALLAREGPRDVRPEGCDLASWNWVAKDRAVFSCHDDRSFVYDAGKTTPAGKLPGACKQAVDHARLRGPDAYTLCAGRLWRSDGKAWQQLRAPGKLRDYALTERCLYAVTERAVWRRCSP